MSSRRAARRILLGAVLVAMASFACSLGSGTGGSDVDRETIPIVLLLAPVNNSVFAEGAQVELYALAQDVRGRVARLEFRVDDVPVADNPPPAGQGQTTLTGRAQWRAAGQSKHMITVEAFTADGLSLGLRDVVVTVVGPPAAGLPGDSNVPAANTPASTATTSAPQADIGILNGPTARVRVADLNVRQGPGTQYPSVGTLAEGDIVQIVGRNADSSWWAVTYRNGIAWVFAELVTPEGDVSGVPLVAPPQ